MERLLSRSTLQQGGCSASTLVERAIALTPGERERIVEAFFARHPGSGEAPPGLGRAILDFQNWEIRSGRIAGHGGSPWWRAVNGAMVLDMAAAMDVSRAPGAGDAWQVYASERGGTQETLWAGHQQSLHRAVDACDALLQSESPAEQAFAAIVVDVVDRTALANRPTDSAELAALVQRFYPAGYPIGEADLPPLERMRARTADSLRGEDGGMFDDVGLCSRRWS